MTDDQDLFDWKRERNRKSAKQLNDRLRRQRREEISDVLSRYGHEMPSIDDLEPPPKID